MKMRDFTDYRVSPVSSALVATGSGLIIGGVADSVSAGVGTSVGVVVVQAISIWAMRAQEQRQAAASVAEIKQQQALHQAQQRAHQAEQRALEAQRQQREAEKKALLAKHAVKATPPSKSVREQQRQQQREQQQREQQQREQQQREQQQREHNTQATVHKSERTVMDSDRAARIAAAAKAQQDAAPRFDATKFAAAVKQVIIGQDKVIDTTADYLLGRYERVRKSQEPLAVLFCVGKSGLGKTEFAKQIAHYLYGADSKALLRIDMGAFSTKETGQTLVGAPSGYVGSDKGGALTRPMIEHSERVVLLDELEKAHDGVFDYLLTLLDEGKLQELSTGQYADFSRSIIVLTTNLLADDISSDWDNERVVSALKATKRMRPELVNRIAKGKLLVFAPLTDASWVIIIDQVIHRLADDYGMTAQISDEAAINLVGRIPKQQGVRGCQAFVETELAGGIVMAKRAGQKQVNITVVNNKCQAT